VRDVLGDDDRASDIEDQSPEDFADSRGVVITNPRRQAMANGSNGGNGDMSKAELQDCIDQAKQILEDAYQPESDRETLAGAIGDALDALSGDYDGDEDDDQDDDDVQG
jgi:hypothetical protein